MTAAPHRDTPETGGTGQPDELPSEGVVEEAQASRSGGLREAGGIAGWAAIWAIVAVGAMTAAYEIKSAFNTDAQDIPAQLPRPVKRKVDSAIKVVEGRGPLELGEGSGVKIRPDFVLTAGHVALSSKLDHFVCTDADVLNVHTRTPNGNHILGQRVAYNISHDRDIAFLRVQRSKAFDRIPVAPIVAEQPDEGDAVFFINYEGGGPKHPSLRYPSERLAELVGRNVKEPVYGHPAEYAGTVIGHKGLDLLVATGTAGYGPKPGRQFNSHPGGSGGPVFNQAGQVVGEAISLGGIESVSDISTQYGVDLPSHPPERRITIVQPVTQDLVRQLLADRPEHAIC